MRILGTWVAVLTAVLIASCGAPSQAQTPEPFVVKGRVVDEAGRPIARAEIVVDNEFLYNSNVTGRTGADGRYRISLPRVASTWNVTGTATQVVGGQSITVDLDPDNPDSLAGNAGAVRNFTARTSGTRPDGGSYGGWAIIYPPYDAMYQPTEVRLHFQPLDGGTAFSRQIENTGAGSAVKDVPIGRYRISATRGGRPMQIRPRNRGAFSSSITSGFNEVRSGYFELEMDVQ
ncbi:MAG: carboxypeptidase regulatory-like domain-containing protein [Brevundimonas sp.]|nr:MAG: carboxypeptidase regulatory-like domain-containing protein [Brevundimonas sp.]